MKLVTTTFVDFLNDAEIIIIFGCTACYLDPFIRQISPEPDKPHQNNNDDTRRTAIKIKGHWFECSSPFAEDLLYLAVVVVVRRLDMFLYQVGLHGNEKVTCCTVSSFHLPHKVLHPKLCTSVREISVVSNLCASSVQHTAGVSAYPWWGPALCTPGRLQHCGSPAGSPSPLSS